MNTNKITAVFGSSEKPTRFSNKAILKLRQYGHTVHALGLREGIVGDVNIQSGEPELNDIDTVTLYLGPQNQPDYYNYIKSLKPRRVIFNPGTENAAFSKLLQNDGVEVVKYCTLVMLEQGTY